MSMYPWMPQCPMNRYNTSRHQSCVTVRSLEEKYHSNHIRAGSIPTFWTSSERIGRMVVPVSGSPLKPIFTFIEQNSEDLERGTRNLSHMLDDVSSWFTLFGKSFPTSGLWLCLKVPL